VDIGIPSSGAGSTGALRTRLKYGRNAVNQSSAQSQLAVMLNATASAILMPSTAADRMPPA
jgi:hypothetical protein